VDELHLTIRRKSIIILFLQAARGRIGVLPRLGTAQDVQWFSVGPGMVLHVLNAFEETVYSDNAFLDGASSTEEAITAIFADQEPSKTAPEKAEGHRRKPVIVLRAMHYDSFTGLGLADVAGGGRATCPEDAYLHEYQLDLETGGVEEKRINDVSFCSGKSIPFFVSLHESLQATRKWCPSS
jgi:carotenoid cleavage dioxygenase-like enzyme